MTSPWSTLVSLADSVASRLRWLPPSLARLTLGWVFVMSGWGKLHGLPDVIDYFRSLGIPAPQFQAPFASSAEFVCGLLILLGLGSRFAPIPLIIVMLVAIITARRKDLGSIDDLFGFIEYLYIVLLLYVFVEGPGPFSIDALIARRRPRL